MIYNKLDNEREILLQISAGDEKAFFALYRHYYAQLRPIVSKYFDEEISKEEILQLAFLKVWLNRDKLPEVENFGAWIYKITYREYLVAVRKRLTYEDKLNKYAETLNAAGSQVLPEERADLEDINRIIQQVVNNLAPQRKTIYELSRNEGLQIGEIAEKLSLSQQTVKNVLSIVLKLIREQLVAAGYGPLSVLIFLAII